MEEYDHKKIEQKWQKHWEEKGLYKTEESSNKPKYFIMDMFPYPSGDGLHVGHPKGYVATDVLARFKKMNGFNILHPMGWDAFGLPAENYALKNKIHPRIAVEKNIDTYKSQLNKIGFTYDWDREINTTDPNYYKWTQWIFIQLFKKGLAYESNEPINWCPSCKTGLANEDLEEGKCERCGSSIEKKPIRQWILKIKEYADRLLEDVDDLDWPESIKISQKNWIGRSYGVNIKNKVKDLDIEFEVYDSIPQTHQAQTFTIIAPEHPLVHELIKGTGYEKPVIDFVENIKEKKISKRFDIDKDMEGIFTGRYVENYLGSGRDIPIWVASFAIYDYGTGIVGCSAHDERDFAFAKKYNIPLKVVLLPEDKDHAEKVKRLEVFYREPNGILQEPEKFKGRKWDEAREDIIDWMVEQKLADRTVNYKLRDWVFSRQRYWGEPIPIIHCEKCGPITVPEEELPVKLPEVESYEPTGTGESPLAGIDEWVNTKCPSCGGDGKRETNTMPQWAGSSWYHLRYIDPKNNSSLVEKEKEKYWSPVDVYVGGAEHATRHLIYARFWHKFLFDIGVVNYKEPFTKLQHVGLINASDGRKMGKRYGNIINPDDVVKNLGADTLRVYEMFMGPFDQSVSWSENGIVGPRRFLEKIWKSQEKIGDSSDLEKSLIHTSIKKVTEDIENLRFNTAISQLMILANGIEKSSSISKDDFEVLLKLIHPFAPHISEELWSIIGNKESIYLSEWPTYDESLLVSDTVTVAIQINGKVRDQVEVEADIAEEELKNLVLEREAVKKWLEEGEPKKVIYVPGKLISIVT